MGRTIFIVASTYCPWKCKHVVMSFCRRNPCGCYLSKNYVEECSYDEFYYFITKYYGYLFTKFYNDE